MAISGKLVDFSLPEILRFLALRQGTGLLSIHTPTLAAHPACKSFYIWLQQGCIVAVSDRLDGQGLMQLVFKRGWMTHRDFTLVLRNASPDSVKTPMGQRLFDQGYLQDEQLRLLFIVQVVQPMCSLFKLAAGTFIFDSLADAPYSEMTGMSLWASKATLVGLRVLRNWNGLQHKLPSPQAGFVKVTPRPKALKLDSQEWQIWEQVTGNLSIHAIAQKLNLPMEAVQQVAFRLSMVGLLEEVPLSQSQIPPLTPLRSPTVEGGIRNLDASSGMLYEHAWPGVSVPVRSFA